MEATIARRFFKSKPARDDHIFWVKAQLWKELHLVDGYFTGLQKELNNLVTSFPEMIKASGGTGITLCSNNSLRSSITMS